MKTTQLAITILTLTMAVLLFSACKDDDEPTTDQTLELELAGDWSPIEFRFDGTSSTPKYYDICDPEAAALYSDTKYAEVLNHISQHLSLNGDKSAVLKPTACSSNPESKYTWAGLKVQNGQVLRLTKDGKEINYQIKTWGGDDLILFPKGFGFDEPNFNIVFKRDK